MNAGLVEINFILVLTKVTVLCVQIGILINPTTVAAHLIRLVIKVIPTSCRLQPYFQSPKKLNMEEVMLVYNQNHKIGGLLF